MRRLFTALAATGFLAASGAAATAQNTTPAAPGQKRLLTSDDLYPWRGWYVSVFGGVHLQGDEGGTSSIGGLSAGSNHDFDTGFQAGVAIGWSWQFGVTNWAIRTEAEYAYSRNSSDSISAAGLSASTGGALQNHSFMGNIYLDYHWRRLVPYVGAGAGLVFTRLTTTAPGSPVEIKGSDTNFGFQAMAGVDYKILPRWRLGVGYKYQMVFGTDYDIKLSGTNTNVGRAKLGTIDSHTILMKLTYQF